MATIGISSPPTLFAANNPVMYKVQTSTIGADTFYKARLSFTGTTLNNYTATLLTFFPTTYSQVFKARDYPNKDWYFYTDVLKDQFGGVIESGITNTQRAGSYAECLQRDTFFNTNYYINYSGNTIDIVSRQPGSRFKLYFFTSSPTGASVNSGITKTVIVTGSSAYEGQTIPDYKFWVDVYTNQNAEFGEALNYNDFNRITGLIRDYQPNDNNQFNIQTIAKSYLHTSKPNFDTSHEVIEDYLQPFFVRWGDQYPIEDYSTVTRKNQLGTSPISWGLNASLDFEQPNNLSLYSGLTSGSTIFAIYDTKFLTNSPIQKRTTRAQNDLLYILIPKNIGKVLQLKANITFWDGSTMSNAPIENSFVIASGLTGSSGGAYKLNVGFNHLGLDTIETDEDKKIKKVVLYIESSEDQTQILSNNSFVANLNPWVNVSQSSSINWEWSASNGGQAIVFLDNTNPNSYWLRQSGLTLQSIPHTFTYNIAGVFQSDDFTIQCLNSLGFVVHQKELKSNLSGSQNITDSYVIPASATTQTTQIQVRFSGGAASLHVLAMRYLSLTRLGDSMHYSENKTYLFENTEPSNRVGISFLNRMGTYDCFDFIGLKEESVDRSKKEITYPVPINDDGSYPEGFKSSANYDIQLTERFVVNSGFINQDTFDWLQELLQSTDIYSYTDDYENFLKVDGYKYSNNNSTNEYNLEVTFVQTLFKNSVNA